MQRALWLSGWKAIAAVGVLIILVAGIVIFAIGVLVVVAPILLLASLVFYFWPGRNAHSVGEVTPKFGAVIEGEFREVEHKAGVEK